MYKDINKMISYIEGEIIKAGYDPYEQLLAYIRTLDARYITRQGNARRLILEIEVHQIAHYISNMKR